MLLLFLLICSFAVSIDSRLDGRPPKDVCENIVNWVCDPDGILSSDSKETVEAYLSMYELPTNPFYNKNFLY